MKNEQQLIEKMTRALTALRAGKLVVVADAEDREAEGDMVGLAEFATTQTVNQMVSQARGLLCVPMSATIADRLALGPMVAHGTDAYGTAFTVSLDAKTTSTGISAVDRARTIQALAAPTSTWDTFYHPGHVFPLIAKSDGVLERQGHTEAAVDLAKLAGATPVAYICEILKKDGHMARRKELKAFAEGSQLPFITIADIIAFRQLKQKTALEALTPVDLPTQYGHFKLQGFSDGKTPPTLLISKGDLSGDAPLLVRLHSECLTGDVLGSKRCDCGPQLHEALRRIEARGRGAVIYLRQEGRGIGLANKLRAYHLQDEGLDTVEANHELGLPADARQYDIAADILKAQGVHQIELMTNNPDKIAQLKQQGITVTKRVPIEVGLTKENQRYLKTKKVKFQHLLREVN